MINKSVGINNRFTTKEKVDGKTIIFENNSFHFLNNSFFMDNSNKTQIIINNYSINDGIVKVDFILIDSIVPIPFNDGNYYLCKGYYIYDKCYTAGESFEMQNQTYYVINQTFEAKKKIGNSCEFNYECGNGSCMDGKCSLGLIGGKEPNESSASTTIEAVGTKEIVAKSHQEESFLIKILNFLFGELR